MAEFIFDASAILAIAFKEPGADNALARMSAAAVSTVNYSEACAKLIDKGFASEEAFHWLETLRLDVVIFDRNDAARAASLRSATKHKRFSFADRACLALAIARNATAVTTDRAWKTIELGCSVELIR
jgi:PIN domain nuclease of toxin-antitoxin system